MLKFLTLLQEDTIENKVYEAHSSNQPLKKLTTKVMDWHHQTFCRLEININKHEPLPKSPFAKVCISPANSDNKYFRWALRAALIYQLCVETQNSESG